MSMMQDNGSLFDEMIHSELEEYLVGGHDNYTPEHEAEGEE